MSAAGGRKGVKKAARENLRKALSEKVSVVEDQELPENQGSKKSRLEELGDDE